MKRATPEQIADACYNRSADHAYAFLRSQGYYVSIKACHEAVARLIENGDRGKLSTKNASPIINDPTTLQMERACARLLRRMLETGHHFISDPDQMEAAVRQAGMIPA
jgi:hypothetical protein